MQKSHVFPAVGAIALSLIATATAAQTAPTKTDTPTAELERLLRDAQSERETTVATAKIQALSNIASYVPRDVYAQKVDAAAKAMKDPIAAFHAHQKAAWAFHELHDDRYGPLGFDGPLGQQGCLRSWKIVGPFDNSSMEGYRDTLGPELGEVGPYSGRLAQVEWRDLPQHDRYCEFDLGRYVQPSTAAVTYVATRVEAPKAQKATLLMGASGAYKVWLNGKLVAQRDVDAGMFTDADAWKIDLTSGSNDLLVKVASTQDGQLGLVARLVDTKLRPLKFAAEGAWTRRPVEGGEPRRDGRGLLAQLDANSKKLTGDDAVWNAWLWKAVNWQNTAVPWRDAAERALEKPQKLSPREHALVAELFEQHWERRAILEDARKRAPDDPWISLAWASELRDSISDADRLWVRRDVQKMAETGFLPAVTFLADIYKSQSLEDRSLAVMDRYKSAQRAKVPAWILRWAALQHSVGKVAAARDADEQAAKVTYLSGGYVWQRTKRLMTARKSKEALTVLQEYLRHVPYSSYARERIAQLHRADGDVDAALAIYDQLIAEAPGDPDRYEAKAEVLLSNGRRAEAIDTLRLALSRRPQDPALRDFLAFLAPDEDRFHEAWLVGNLRELADATKEPPFNYDTLVDNTVVQVNTNGLASSVTQRVERVLNPDGVDAVKATRASYQQGDESVEVLRVRVYKPDGTISEDYEQWDSSNSRKASTTYNDTAYVTMQANDVQVGDVVEFVYRTNQIANENFRGDYFGDIAYLQGGRPIAFQRYAVVFPEAWKLHFRAPKLKHQRIDGKQPDGKPVAKGFQSASFEMKNVPYVESDPSQPGYSDVYDYLLVSNKATYDEIGKWWWNLVEEQLIVDEPIRKKVAELTNGLTSEDEKLAAIHNYVVKNTRYLHVGLGIHGWKPYRTSTCFRNRYGDCKDKAALLKVMLEEAGIPANLVLVRTRRLGTVEEYPASMHVFNHAITYVPSKDLYLDGTAEFNGTTELTSMDQGAQAVVIQDGGKAKMVTLPIDEADDNLNRMTLEVDLTGEQPVTRGTIRATGANAVYFRQSLEDPERRDEALESQLADEFPGARLTSAKYRNLTELEKPTEIDFTFEGGQMVRQSGAREYVFPVGRQKNLLDAYAKRATRDQDLDIRVPFASETSIRYRLGPTKSLEKLPRSTDLESEFGGLSIDWKRDGDAVVVDVRYSIAVQRVKVEDYQKFRAFLTEVTAALNETVEVVEAQ